MSRKIACAPCAFSDGTAPGSPAWATQASAKSIRRSGRAPLAAMIVQMAISRTQEYAADRGGAEISGQPLWLASALARLDQALKDDVAVAVAASGGRLHPICALWRTTTLPVLVQRAGNGRLSLNGLSEAAGRVIVDWPIDPRDPFLNINTPDDLAHAEAMTL